MNMTGNYCGDDDGDTDDDDRHDDDEEGEEEGEEEEGMLVMVMMMILSNDKPQPTTFLTVLLVVTRQLFEDPRPPDFFAAAPLANSAMLDAFAAMEEPAVAHRTLAHYLLQVREDESSSSLSSSSSPTSPTTTLVLTLPAFGWWSQEVVVPRLFALLDAGQGTLRTRCHIVYLEADSHVARFRLVLILPPFGGF
jgi:hypothetical protein